MIRAFALAAALLLAGPAAAQTPPGDSDQLARASRAISFLWRPVAALRADTLNAACGGAEEEIDAVESALPAVLTPASLARVRTLHGLLIIPTDAPANPYFFPDASMTWFTSGLGGIAVLNEGEGFIGVRDAGGRELAFQLGSAGGKPILRIRDPQGAILNFVGCAPTLAP
jgi:hypothetical protein